MTNLLDESQALLEQSRMMLSETSMPNIEQQRDLLIEKASGLETLVEGYEQRIDTLKKQRRAITDMIEDIKVEQRPFIHLMKDMVNLSKRLNNRFFRLREEKAGSGLTSKQ